MMRLQRIETVAASGASIDAISKDKPEAFRLEVERPDRLEKTAVSIVGSYAEFDDQTRLMRPDGPHRKGNVFQCRRSPDTTNRIVQFDARAHNLIAPHRHRSGNAST